MKKNNYGLISILFAILILFSCEKDLYHDQIYQKNNNSRLLKGEEAKAVYDRLQNLLNENSVYKKTTNNNGVIQYDEVLQVIDTLGNSKYTFEVNHPQSSEKKFFNLVFSEKNNQSKAKLVEYRMSNEFYNQYKTHRNFRLFAGEVHFTTLASKTPCPPDSDFWMQVLPPSSGSSGNWGNENPHSGVITPIPISDPFPDTPGGGSNPAGNDSSDNFDVEDPVYDFQTFYRINPSVIEPTTSPCGDDDNSGVIVPDDITSYLSLSAEQLNWWDNIADSSTKDSILTYLQENTVNGLISNEAQEFVSNLINYLISNPNINWNNIFESYFTPYPETGDNVEINPDNITYETQITSQSLPSLSSFTNSFPKNGTNGNYTQMPAPDVYNLVGGSLLNSYIANPDDYSNACSIRGARGLLYSNIQIPVIRHNGTQRTQKGGDLKNYILDAVTFNKFMIDKFGDTPHKLEGAAANDPQQVLNFLSGKNGIYVIINNNGSPTGGAGYTGHVDLIINGECIGGEYLNPKGGVKSIRVWVLN